MTPSLPAQVRRTHNVTSPDVYLGMSRIVHVIAVSSTSSYLTYRAISSTVSYRIVSYQATATRSLSSKSTTLSSASLARTPEQTSSRCDTTRSVLSCPILLLSSPLLSYLNILYPLELRCNSTVLCCFDEKLPKKVMHKYRGSSLLCYICRISIHTVSRNL